MPALARIVVVICLLVLAGTPPAAAWWRYAEWGMSEGQIIAASQGTAVPCQSGAPVCTPTPSGATPRLHVPSVNVVGLPASTAFVFDGNGQLSQTIVLFANADPGLVTNSLQGALGKPVEDGAAASPVRTWRDERHGTVITATSGSAGTTLVYQRMTR